VSDDTALREMFGPWYCSPSIMRMIKPGRMRWAGHVACIGEKRHEYRVFFGKKTHMAVNVTIKQEH